MTIKLVPLTVSSDYILEAQDCVYTSSDGLWNYNLTSFSSVFPYLEFSKDNKTYYYVPCSDFARVLESNDFPEVCSSSAVCVREIMTFFNGGNSLNPIWSDGANTDSGVSIVYSQGDICGLDGTPRKTVVNLHCYLPQDAPMALRSVDPQSAYSYISRVDDIDECAVTMDVFTPLACPTNRPADPACAFLSEENCLNVKGCYCGFCDGQCVAFYEQCSSERVFDCNGDQEIVHSNISFVVNLCFVSSLVSFCLLSAVYFRIRAKRVAYQKLAHASQVDQSLKDGSHEMNSFDVTQIQPQQFPIQLFGVNVLENQPYPFTPQQQYYYIADQ